MNAQTGIGQSVRRSEDARFLTGAGRYVSDIDLPHQAQAVILYSPHAHAAIKSIDVREAQAMPGVLAVLTGADVRADGLGPIQPPFLPRDQGGPACFVAPQPVLAGDRVRYVGDRVAMVVADTAQRARDAAEMIAVDYEILPSITDLAAAMAPGVPILWPGCDGNIGCSWSMGDPAAAERGFAAAAHVVSVDLVNNRVAIAAMEPRAAIGVYHAAARAYELYASSQSPHTARRALAQDVLRIAEGALRVISPDVGGGFGLKGNVHPEDALVLWASRRVGRPVKWVATRAESMMGDRHARDHIVHGELALDAAGRILALRSTGRTALGAYTQGAFAAQAMFALRLIPGAYAIPAVDVTCASVFTNTAPVASYRGPGRAEAIYLIERLLDRAGAALGLAPDEIRRRNLVPAASMPYRTATGFTYDSGDFAAAMARALEAADWNGFPARAAASAALGRLRGRAVTSYVDVGGIFNDRMDLRFDPDGGVVIMAGTHSHGQGHETVFPQLVSEFLGVPFESVRLVQGDTDKVAFGRGTFAARSALVGGCALRVAADEVIRKAKRLAAHLLEVSAEDLRFEAGRFTVLGTDRMIRLVDVARAAYRPAGLPAEFGLGLDASGAYAIEHPSFPNGCHVCELEVDPETGAVSLARYTVVDDVGVALNPMICEGQVHGGLAQGIGQAMLEHMVYDPASGQLLSGSFQDYCMPRADDLPAIDVGFANVPATTNPLGVKGVGESGTVGAPPTIINALLDALRPLGVHHIDMPATPARVRAARVAP